MDGDVVNISSRIRFDKVLRGWTMDSSQRSINIISNAPSTFSHYIHLRQIANISTQGLEMTKDVTIRGFLFIINSGTSGIVTVGKYNTTYMFKLKPGEFMLIKPQKSAILYVQSTVDNTPIDLLMIQKMVI